jgi:hypothetical protein
LRKQRFGVFWPTGETQCLCDRVIVNIQWTRPRVFGLGCLFALLLAAGRHWRWRRCRWSYRGLRLGIHQCHVVFGVGHVCKPGEPGASWLLRLVAAGFVTVASVLRCSAFWLAFRLKLKHTTSLP